MKTSLVETPEALVEVSRLLSACTAIPLDVESNGLHAYRNALCVLQLAAVRGDEIEQVFIVDTLRLGDEPLGALREVLGPGGPPKILHDLAFDVRILAAHGVLLGNVIDTAIAARFLGEKSTGLSSLAESKLGVKLSKELQHHDWGRRPLTEDLQRYLVDDVAYLPALAQALFGEATARDVVPEIEAETGYRLATSLAAKDEIDPRPPYVRIKGVSSLEPLALSVLRHLAEVREEAARRWDLPPFKVVGNDVLIDLAKKRPSDPADLRKVKGLDRGRATSLVPNLRRAIADGVREGDVPPEERARFFTEPPRPPRLEIEARRAREHRLSAWRRRVAKERSVDEQVVLPGHCVQEIVDRVPDDLEELAHVPGLGLRRLERDGAAILAALHGTTT